MEGRREAGKQAGGRSEGRGNFRVSATDVAPATKCVL